MAENTNRNYVIGVDFGTLSGRTVLVCLEDGAEVAACVMAYPHGVMERELPKDETAGRKAAIPLKSGSAIQDPRDYMEVFEWTVRDVMAKSGVAPENIIGIAVDSTASTLLPVDETGTPLCASEEWKDEPHAYLKLWKHHACQKEATHIEAAIKSLDEQARQVGETPRNWLARYGNQVSAEWTLPKILEVLWENEALYDAVSNFVEAGDWVIWNLTGEKKRSACMAGYKLFWGGNRSAAGHGSAVGDSGYPPREFFEAVDPRLSHLVETKLAGDVIPAGSPAGRLTKEAADRLGLAEGTVVASAVIDAHAALPALGLTGPGKMLMIIGTSTCHIIMDEKESLVPGISGVVKDGIVPGLYAYEAGQSAVGDIFAWFVDHCVPKSYHDEAAAQGIGLHALMEEKALALQPGGAGLVALDWWNGNRSILSNTDLSGMIVGLTLRTKPEEIYRALLEATAYGARVIMDTYRENGVEIHELYAAGGIPAKNPLLMQIYADVMQMPIRVPKNPPSAGLGSAVFAAAASGYFASVEEAAQQLAHKEMMVYMPDPQRAKRYESLFEIYKELHDWFGGKQAGLMRRLRELAQGCEKDSGKGE